LSNIALHFTHTVQRFAIRGDVGECDHGLRATGVALRRRESLQGRRGQRREINGVHGGIHVIALVEPDDIHGGNCGGEKRGKVQLSASRTRPGRYLFVALRGKLHAVHSAVAVVMLDQGRHEGIQVGGTNVATDWGGHLRHHITHLVRVGLHRRRLVGMTGSMTSVIHLTLSCSRVRTWSGRVYRRANRDFRRLVQTSCHPSSYNRLGKASGHPKGISLGVVDGRCAVPLQDRAYQEWAGTAARSAGLALRLAGRAGSADPDGRPNRSELMSNGR
jgi:hypothetical protein